MTSGLAKRSIRLAGHATSIALEPEFWAVLDSLAVQQGCALSAIVAEVDSQRSETNGVNLASALRVYVLKQTLSFPPNPG